MKKQQKCYIYTRVSTSMQVEGYSLDAQKDKLRKYAEYQEMSIVGEYSDEGKSGKSVEGRPQFKHMLADIESGKDNVDYVLVFKLSRFGRNAADVLSSLQKMQDYGVNLICVEDGIDSSKYAGKLMISILSAVAEIERENILVQTMECRRQKAREEMWNQAHRKRQETGVLQVKTHSLEHEHILSGIIKCPVCGSGMYGNVNRKKHPDGSYYKDYFYYACKHRRLVDGHKCGYRKQWSEEKINNAVEEVIRKLVKNPKFEEAILNKIGSRIDTEEIEKEIEGLEKQHRQLTGAKARLGQQMDSLDIMDKFYEKKYQDMETRLYRLYDEIEGVENSIEEVKNRLLNIRQQKISEENVYQFLLYFDKLYDKFTDLEKKEFLNSFVEQVDIYEQEQPDGRFLKHIKFRFPVYFGDKETQELCWDNESTVETVCCLHRVNS